MVVHVNADVVQRLAVGATLAGRQSALPEGIVQRAEVDEFARHEPVQEAQQQVAQRDHQQEGPHAAAEATEKKIFWIVFIFCIDFYLLSFCF